MSLTELLHYLRLGGVTMAILLLASVVALGVAIERIIALWGVSENSRVLGETVHKHLLRGDLAAARTAAERSKAAVADIFLAGFDRLERARLTGGGVESAVERERAQVGLRLRRNLWLLATIGSLAPFVGLFGTVAGIMRSFKDLGLDVDAGGTGGTATVMTGISEALIATAVGILVAVMAMVFYNYFQARLARVLVELRLLGDEFVELLHERPTLPAAPVLPEPTARGDATPV
ncbi:MotA/TolQ/ExbB proton channel family protein [Stigmatella hybrida]|uniref:MotA/TolQ/ExbB proton channel family protein n=1 Tax=Stigmatella hybrida TaxID=394097 RepID=UPI001CDA79B0|nr:MotA/TolQ/ExbB proton channel family protein [Stigmatella hybrida]